MEETIDLKDLIHLLLGRIWLIILVTVLGGAAAFGISKFCLPLEYASNITMYVQSYYGVSGDTDVQNNISNSKQLVNTYMEVMKDDAVMNAVADCLHHEYSNELLSRTFSISNDRITPSSLRSCLSISSVTDTSAVKVVATAKDPEIAAAICNCLTSVAPRFVEDAVGVGSINTIDRAKIYNTPVAPNNIKNTLVGMAAAFLLIVLLIIVMDFFDNTIKDADNLGKRYNKAIIGEIQQFAPEKKRNRSAQDYLRLTDKDVPFYVVESYKSIRTNVTFSLSTTEQKIFAVSSANPGEGKSTTSANIAIALAQSGNQVLLIDADMRKSMQHKIFSLKNKKGLSSAISKMHKLEDCIQKNVLENLDIMTAGPTPPNPSELLASQNMDRLLDELNKQYDIIIIDTSPVNVVTDAMELAKNISGIIMVVCYGKTTNEALDAAVKKTEFAQMNLFGFILNGVKTNHGGRYYKKDRYYYKKGYGYGYYGANSEKDDKDAEEETA